MLAEHQQALRCYIVGYLRTTLMGDRTILRTVPLFPDEPTTDKDSLLGLI